MEDPFSRKDLIYTIYQEKSISKAAQKLFISQPSLSVMVKKIEDSIGLPLFDRSCKPLRLTEAGKEYIWPQSKSARLNPLFPITSAPSTICRQALWASAAINCCPLWCCPNISRLLFRNIPKSTWICWMPTPLSWKTAFYPASWI